MALLAAVLTGLTVWLSTAHLAPGSLRRLNVPGGDRNRPRLLQTVEEGVGRALGRVLCRLGMPPGAAGLARDGHMLPDQRLGRSALAAGALAAAVTALVVIAGSRPAPYVVLSAMVAGGLLPGWWGGRARRARSRELASDLPQLLDFLVVCQQAGLNLRGSLEKGARAVGGRLGSELRALLDTVPPARLLTELGERYGCQELKVLGGALWQGELLGLPVADVLRAQAEGLREAHRRRVQAAAATAPLKLSLCTVCLFLPAVLALVLVPQLLLFLSRW